MECLYRLSRVLLTIEAWIAIDRDRVKDNFKSFRLWHFSPLLILAITLSCTFFFLLLMKLFRRLFAGNVNEEGEEGRAATTEGGEKAIVLQAVFGLVLAVLSVVSIFYLVLHFQDTQNRVVSYSLYGMAASLFLNMLSLVLYADSYM